MVSSNDTDFMPTLVSQTSSMTSTMMTSVNVTMVVLFSVREFFKIVTLFLRKLPRTKPPTPAALTPRHAISKQGNWGILDCWSLLNYWAQTTVSFPPSPPKPLSHLLSISSTSPHSKKCLPTVIANEVLSLCKHLSLLFVVGLFTLHCTLYIIGDLI